MVKLIGMLSRFKPLKALVIGDFMLDTYTTGKVKRISPEAPVSILHVQKQESRPGGAGNVVLNLISLGLQVVAVGRVGVDFAGEQLKAALESEGVDTEGILYQKGFQTPVKNRLIADAQQVLRVDFETVTSVPEILEQTIVEKLSDLLEGCQIVAVSDYGKGFLSRFLLTTIIGKAKTLKIPVIVDPKGDDFTKYYGATVLKPNLTEAFAAAKLDSEASLDEVGKAILKIAPVDELLITRSEAGISLFRKGGQRFDFPVRSKEVKDVTGAGDTVLAVLSAALANGIDIKYGAMLANIAAGMVIERIGCVRITLSELAERLLEFDVENKIFDEEHLFALEQSLKNKKTTILSLESSGGMSTAIFRTIRKLSSSRGEERKLVVYVRDKEPDEEFVTLLSSLSDIDFIVLRCESLKNLCSILKPQEVYVIDSEKLLSMRPNDELLIGSAG